MRELEHRNIGAVAADDLDADRQALGRDGDRRMAGNGAGLPGGRGTRSALFQTTVSFSFSRCSSMRKP
jgi:hypothetical protein